MKLYNWIFRKNRTEKEVTILLHAVLDKTITSEDWDDLISIKIVDPKLEKIRWRLETIWIKGSPYLLPNSINPTDLSLKGVKEIRCLIDSIEENK